MNANILLELGPLTLTKYGVLIAMGALLWLLSAMGVRQRRYRGVVTTNALCVTSLLMVVLGLIVSRAVYCATRYSEYLPSQGALLQALYLWRGGYSLGGAIAGAFLGISLGAALCGVRAGRIANCFAPGLLLFAACAGAARLTIGAGWGRVTEAEWLISTPLTLTDINGESRYAVYRLESVAYLLAFAFLFARAMRRNVIPKWHLYARALALYGALTLPLSSMIEGDILVIIEYVRIEQVCAFLILLTLNICLTARLRRVGAGKKAIAAWLLFAAGIAVVVSMEFAVDDLGALERKYACMIAGAALAGISVPLQLRAAYRPKKRKSRG